ncbi:MAG: Rieske (2Fe-2S) iron-sulfur domain protein [Frankiales bacterium]|nr:Rieske (2Fe-2S) iron-sulfur domain protein [Frankiales bacterium]
MPTPDSIPAASLPPGAVGRAGRWAVVNRGGTVTAVSPRCRHQLADLSKGSLDAHGCLVCPWHGSRYDVDTGAMVEGPKGFLTYVGRTPGYTQLVKAYGTVLRLARHTVSRQGERYVVDPG